jgi:hypothetical protein
MMVDVALPHLHLNEQLACSEGFVRRREVKMRWCKIAL